MNPVHYQNILVATDLHDKDLPVVRKAVSLAKTYGAKLHVITVGPKIHYYLPVDLSSLSDFEKRIDQESEEKLKFVRSKIDIDANYIKAYGIEKVEILNAVRRTHADLLVIGSHGHQGARAILGSTVNSILHDAECDVMVVRIKKKE